jgi:putative DNA-invertase from lambdoid prophage Rac
MAVWGYVRVSTQMQVDEGESLTTQERQVRAYAELHGMRLDGVFVEKGVSGSLPLNDRPQGARLLAGMKPGDAIITPKLDRMFRSALDALGVMGGMRERGIALHMIDLGGDVTGNGVAKLVFTVLAAVAEAERDRIRERITDVKRDQKARGRYLGGSAPFGYRIGNDGTLMPDEAQQAAIREAIELKAQGVSIRGIADLLKRKGHVLSHVTTARVLKDARA